MCTASRKSCASASAALCEAARALRAAEGLARSAVALLNHHVAHKPAQTSTAQPVSGGGHSEGAATRKVSRSAKRRQRKAAAKAAVAATAMDEEAETPQLTAQQQGLMTPQLLQGIADQLTASLSSSTSLSTSSASFYPNGTLVQIHGLAAKLELEGAQGTILGTTPSADGTRYQVSLSNGGDKVLVKPSNLHPVKK
eukprot:12424270-Karenia_brevis.AAC.1